MPIHVLRFSGQFLPISLGHELCSSAMFVFHCGSLLAQFLLIRAALGLYVPAMYGANRVRLFVS